MSAAPTLNQLAQRLATYPPPPPPHLLVYADAALQAPTERYRGTIYAGVPTLQEALARVKAGGTIRIRAGVYRGAAADTDASFVARRPLTLEAYEDEQPVLTFPLDYPDRRYPIILRVEGHGITVRGLRFVGTRTVAGALAKANITLSHRGNHGEQGNQPVGIQDCVFEDAGLSAILCDVPIAPVTIERCQIDGAGFTAQEHGIYVSGGSNVTIRDNDISGAAGYGIHLYDGNASLPANCVINGNLSHHNDYGGILIGGANHDIQHNTFVDNAVSQVQTWRGAKGNRIQNNIAWHTDVRPQRADWCKELPDNPQDYTVTHNDIGSIQDSEGVWLPYLRANNLNIDPQFTDGYRLHADSPLHTAGVDGSTIGAYA